MAVRVRPALAGLPSYRPGRTPADLAREYGVVEATRLAANESPYGPLPGVVEAVARAVGQANRYPDNGARELSATLADRLGVPPEQVTVGCGSVGLCEQVTLALAGPGDDVVYGWRSFEAYPVLSAICGASSVRVPLREDAAYDLDAMAGALSRRTRLVFVCNPNNPTGTVVRAAELEKFLDRVPEDVPVVLDEAYREYVTDPDVPDGVELARRRDNVVVLRTLSKAYGLAGLRVGYCVAAPAVIGALRAVQLPFAVNALAQAAALAALAQEDEMRSRVGRVVAERGRVAAALRELGVAVPRTEANFVWLPLGAATSEFGDACERRGVLLRGFPGDGVRVTIGTAAENDRFLAVAAELLPAYDLNGPARPAR